MLAVGAAGVLAVAVGAVATYSGVVRYVLVAGWLAHAGWDVFDRRAFRAASGGESALCLACDVMIAGSLIAVASL